jgi:hypothetical protein
MTKFCSTCTKTGYLGERVEMKATGSRYVKGKQIKTFECPVCDTIKAEILHQNGLSTTQTLTATEVAQLPREGVGLLGALVLVAAVVIASQS